MSKYDFNGKRCKAAVRALSALVDLYGTEIEQRALDLLITDIEDLHRRAVARDDLLDAVENVPSYEGNRYGEIVMLDDLRTVTEDYQETKRVQDLNL